tara:strand:+ start:36 stop:410 length:375 start_codon:yes stop_codon:yes gene_type:complete
MPVHDIKCNNCSKIDTKYVDLDKKESWICDFCDSSDVFVYFGNFKSNSFLGVTYYMDIDNFGEGITSKEIDRKCKEKGMVYGTQDEIQREASRYRTLNKKESDKRDQKIVDKIEHEFRKRMVGQ